MTNDLYTLDEDIANNNFIDCVQNAEADLNTDLPLQEYCYDPFEEIDSLQLMHQAKYFGYQPLLHNQHIDINELFCLLENSLYMWFPNST